MIGGVPAGAGAAVRSADCYWAGSAGYYWAGSVGCYWAGSAGYYWAGSVDCYWAGSAGCYWAGSVDCYWSQARWIVIGQARWIVIGQARRIVTGQTRWVVTGPSGSRLRAGLRQKNWERRDANPDDAKRILSVSYNCLSEFRFLSSWFQFDPSDDFESLPRVAARTVPEARCRSLILRAYKHLRL